MTAMPTVSTSGDEAAIVGAVLDDFEGWFEGDAARMDRALHPELAKRSIGQTSSDPDRLETITKRQMVDATAAGVGGRRDPGDRRIEVHVQDMSGRIANVTVRSAVYVEYLQLARTRAGWRIVNALWRYA
jgi:Putative lumazine-binding